MSARKFHSLLLVVAVVEFSATSYIGSEDSQAVFVELQREFAEDTVTLTLVLTEGTAEGVCVCAVLQDLAFFICVFVCFLSIYLILSHSLLH